MTDHPLGAGPAVGDGHLDDDTLADLQEDLLEPAAARPAGEHLAGCPVCADRADRLARAARACSPTPATAGPVPVEVATGIDAALSAEAVSRRRTGRAHRDAAGPDAPPVTRGHAGPAGRRGPRARPGRGRAGPQRARRRRRRRRQHGRRRRGLRRRQRRPGGRARPVPAHRQRPGVDRHQPHRGGARPAGGPALAPGRRAVPARERRRQRHEPDRRPRGRGADDGTGTPAPGPAGARPAPGGWPPDPPSRSASRPWPTVRSRRWPSTWPPGRASRRR